MWMTGERGVLVDALIEKQNGETPKEKGLAPSSCKGDNLLKYSRHAFLSILAI